jgi:hypothetical protein
MEASKIGGTEEDDEGEAEAAQVEAEIEGDTGDPEKARAVFERGYKALKERGEKENVSWRCLPLHHVTDIADVFVCWISASRTAGSLEIVRGGARLSRRRAKGARDDAQGHEKVATSRRWQWARRV